MLGFSKETIILSRRDDGTPAELKRWRWKPWKNGPGIMLHRHDGPDPGRALHDHPWTFSTLILRGGYVEEFDHQDWATDWIHPSREWRAGSFHRISLDAAHRITKLLRKPTWTVVFHGPTRHKWGFYPISGFVRDDEIVDWSEIEG